MKTEPEYMPTPEEIRQACLAIQATWSEAERARRRAMIPARKPAGNLDEDSAKKKIDRGHREK
jgi:hypothetical protein